MNKNFSKLTKSIKFQIFIVFAAVLLLFKLFLAPADIFPLNVINEILVALTAASLIIYLINLLKKKRISPISLVIGVGIVNALIFFFVSFSEFILTSLFENLNERINKADLVYNFISFLYVFVILGFVSYIFLTFKELYFLRQKKNESTYFNTMIIFFILASLTSLLNTTEGFAYINNTFFIISILLIIINSINISWIAFLLKKEKVFLLILSVVISVLFIVNLVNSGDETTHNNVLSGFSPALNQFFNIIMIYGAIYFSILFFTTLFHIPTAEAFDRKAQEVSSLQYFSQLITQVLDFNDLAETVTELAQKICNADAAWIAWQEDNELKPIALKNVGYVDADILIKIFVDNKTSDSNKTSLLLLEKFKNQTNPVENYYSLAAAPLKAHTETRGYLIVVKKDKMIFDEEDINAINTFSDYASVSIENSRLLEESIEKERLEKELDVAREIQRKILPAKDPVLEKLSISSVFIPAFEVGGDYYDFFEIDNPSGHSDKFGFIIADVSGKGISAAFIMAEIKGIFESLSKTIENPKDILVKANHILKRTLDRKNFISAAYGVIDMEKETLKLARAGHCPILLIRNGIIEELRPKGIGLGLNYTNFFEDSLTEIEISLHENDTIVLYTDGVTEAKNKKLEDFGDNKFEEILLEFNTLSADEISNRVIREVTLFTQDNSQHDDITLVILKWKSRYKRDKQKLNDGEKEWQNSIHQLKTKIM